MNCMLRDIKKQLLEQTVPVPIKYSVCDHDKGSRLFVSKYLFTNEAVVQLLNANLLSDIRMGSYTLLNIYNPSLPIKYQNNRYSVEDKFANHPVCGITWDGAARICKLLRGRLSTELEWEFLAGGGNNQLKYPWGNTEPTKKLANYNEYIGSTTPVGSYECNSLGIYDMAGNAEEWCQDWFYPEKKPLKNILHLEKVVKGGSWNKDASHLLISSRRGKWYRIGTVGISFRIIWEDREDDKMHNI